MAGQIYWANMGNLRTMRSAGCSIQQACRIVRPAPMLRDYLRPALLKNHRKPSQILAEIWQASFESADAEAYHSEVRSRSHCSHCRLSVLAQQQDPERNQDDHGHTVETVQNASFASSLWQFLSRDGASHRGGKKCSHACTLLYGNEGRSRDHQVLGAQLASGAARTSIAARQSVIRRPRAIGRRSESNLQAD